MALARALQTSGSALRRNPIVVGVVLVVSLVQLPTQFAQLAGPLVSAGVSLAFSLVAVFAAPFVFGGLIRMADEALDGTTSLDALLEAGKRYYTSMLGAYLLLLGGAIALGIVASFLSVALVSTVGILSGGPSGSTDPLFVGMFLIGTATFLLVVFVPLFFVQFYGQAIVLDGQSAIGGFTRSIGLVRRNLASVVGYSILVFGAGTVFGLVGSVPSTLLSMQSTPVAMGLHLPDVSLPVAVGLTVVGNLLLGLLGSLFLVFSVAFYRTLDAPAVGENPPESRGTAP